MTVRGDIDLGPAVAEYLGQFRQGVGQVRAVAYIAPTAGGAAMPSSRPSRSP